MTVGLMVHSMDVMMTAERKVGWRVLLRADWMVVMMVDLMDVMMTAERKVGWRVQMKAVVRVVMTAVH